MLLFIVMINQELIRRWEKNFGKDEVRKLLDIKNKISNDTYIRVNLSKTSVNDVCDFLKSNRVKFSETFLPNCLKIEKSFFNLSSSLLSLSGEIYIQDIASQVPVNCIDFKWLKSLNRCVNILDMAASPGSKTTQICDMLKLHNIEYNLIALEPEVKRLQKLINNLHKQECVNVSVVNSTGQKFNSEIKFDLILLDAPCSGNLIGDRNWLDKRDVKGILERSNVQKDLLKSAKSLLNENGVLIYSTCSLELEENEENVKFAKDNLDLKDVKCSLNFPFSTKPLLKGQESIRFMPTKSMTQGFFVSILKK